MSRNRCNVCGQEFVATAFSSGYGLDRKGHKVCYDCCGKQDAAELEQLPEGEKMALYIVEMPDGVRQVTNWPSTLKVPISIIRRGYTGRSWMKRRDVWFAYKGGWYYGRNQGDSDILIVKRLKGKPPKSVVLPMQSV